MICIRCNKPKLLTELVKNKKSKNGCMRWCRSCFNDYCRFGGKRNQVLERDDYKCVKCGMTDAEHRNRWKKSLSVDHIDNFGKRVPMRLKNNALSNLQTLCLPCHSSKDICFKKLNDEKVKFILNSSLPRKELAKKFKVIPRTIWEIQTGRTYKQLFKEMHNARS